MLFTTRVRLVTKLLAFAALLAGTTVQAQLQFTLQPTRDNTLFEESAAQNSNGSGNSLFAGRINQGPLRRAVIAFDDLPALLPGARVTSVELALHVSRSRSPEAVFTTSR